MILPNTNQLRHYLSKSDRGGYWHTDISGNNEISHQERIRRGSIGQLRVTPFQCCSLEGFFSGEVTVGNRVVFEEVIGDKLVSACGVSALSFFEVIPGVPCCVVDNHNWVLPTIVSCLRGKNSPMMIHIDQHADMSNPGALLDPLASYDQIWQYTIHQTTIASWIVPLIEAGMISDIHQVRSGYAMEQLAYRDTEKKPYRLDIDMDFWMPEAGYSRAEIDHHRDIIARLVPRAQGVSIATSPCFMDQQLALQMTRQMILILTKSFSI